MLWVMGAPVLYCKVTREKKYWVRFTLAIAQARVSVNAFLSRKHSYPGESIGTQCLSFCRRWSIFVTSYLLWMENRLESESEWALSPCTVDACCRLRVSQGSILASLKKGSRIVIRVCQLHSLLFFPFSPIAAETKYGSAFLPQTFNFCHPIKKTSLKHCSHLEQKLIRSPQKSEVFIRLRASLSAWIVVLWFPTDIFVFSAQQWAPQSRYFLWSLYCQWAE